MHYKGHRSPGLFGGEYQARALDPSILKGIDSLYSKPPKFKRGASPTEAIDETTIIGSLNEYYC